MEIKVFQSGGFAGERIQLKKVADEQLPADKLPLLKSLLTKAETFYAAHQENAGGEVGADMLQYEIEVPDNKGTHLFKFVKSSNNQPMADLLNFLLSV